MNEKIAVVIRNKNESQALDRLLRILTKLYALHINEIILVDNLSTDDSLEIAKKYNCKIVLIDHFTYGRAINFGIEACNSKYILLLSSHAYPIGKNFFVNTIEAIKQSDKVAGVRFINSMSNYERALNNDFVVNEPLKFGLMAACCVVNKTVWNSYKFDENLVFGEDKEWSKRVTDAGYKILDLNETFFYSIKRTTKGLVNRYKNETLTYYEFNNIKFPSFIRITLSLIKKIIITNTLIFFKTLRYDFLIYFAKVEMFKILKKRKYDR